MWDFLDKMNYNLLYSFADNIAGNTTYNMWNSKDEYEQKQNILYLIWFIYRYILGCETLEEALKLDGIAILSYFNLYTTCFTRGQIFLGGGELKICLSRKNDVQIILEILYNRYGFLEQLDCFYRHQKNKKDRRSEKCLMLREMYITLRGNETRAK